MEPQEPEKKEKARRWLKRLGIAGFVFFLAKGILWLIVGGALYKACTGQ